MLHGPTVRALGQTLAMADGGPRVGDERRRQAVVGVDIGGSGVKAAAVDVHTGDLLTDRERLPTPQPATPAAVGDVVAQLVASVGKGVEPLAPVGCTVPSVVTDGVVRTAANIDDAWVGDRSAERFAAQLGRQVTVLNDADAAGLAEVRFGAARDVRGTVLLLTLGTGIGSALFHDGVLVPNTELGHLELHGRSAERYAAASVRQRKQLSWKDWSGRLDEYLDHVVLMVRPVLIVLGGGVSRHSEKFVPRLTVDVPVVPAELGNAAGVVGAALAAAELAGRIDVPGFELEDIAGEAGGASPPGGAGWT